MPVDRQASSRVIARVIAAFAVGALATALLVACQPEPTTTNSPGTHPTPSSSAEPTTAPTETAVPDEQATAVSIPCDSIVSAQAMYDFNPNFGLLASFTPDSGSLAAKAVADKGVVCRWINQTSGVTIDFTISQPSPAAFDSVRSAASAGTSVGGLGDEAYFSTSGDEGIVQAFSGPYWVTATSVTFSAAGDALGLMTEAVAAVN